MKADAVHRNVTIVKNKNTHTTIAIINIDALVNALRLIYLKIATRIAIAQMNAPSPSKTIRPTSRGAEYTKPFKHKKKKSPHKPYK